MPSVPVPADPGWDDDLAWLDRDPMTPAELEAQLDRLCELDEADPADEDEYWDHDDLTAEELADIREAAADELLAVEAASTGRRGPGQPGSARVFPGESASTAAGFGTGMPLDVTPGCPELAVAADAAVGGGDEDCFDGVADHELIGRGSRRAPERRARHATARHPPRPRLVVRGTTGPDVDGAHEQADSCSALAGVLGRLLACSPAMSRLSRCARVFFPDGGDQTLADRRRGQMTLGSRCIW